MSFQIRRRCQTLVAVRPGLSDTRRHIFLMKFALQQEAIDALPRSFRATDVPLTESRNFANCSYVSLLAGGDTHVTKSMAGDIGPILKLCRT
jgi:hypothetical protein